MSRRLASEFGSADDSVGLLLWQVTNRWQAAQRAALKPFGLTHVQFVLLASLVWLTGDEPVTQRDLAAHAATDPMMTSHAECPQGVSRRGPGLIDTRPSRKKHAGLILLEPRATLAEWPPSPTSSPT